MDPSQSAFAPTNIMFTGLFIIAALAVVAGVRSFFDKKEAIIVLAAACVTCLVVGFLFISTGGVALFIFGCICAFAILFIV